MRTWEGVQRDMEPFGSAAEYCENTCFYTEGELQRRRGLVKFSASTGGQVIAPFWHPAQGNRAVFFLSTGSVVEVAAT